MSGTAATGQYASSFKARLAPSEATQQNLATIAKALLVALASIALTATILGGLVQGRVFTPAMLPKVGTYAVIGGATTLGTILGGSLIKLFVDRRESKGEKPGATPIRERVGSHSSEGDNLVPRRGGDGGTDG